MGNFSSQSNQLVQMVDRQKVFIRTMNHHIYGDCDLYKYGDKFFVIKLYRKPIDIDFAPAYGHNVPHVIRYLGQIDHRASFCGSGQITQFYYEYCQFTLLDYVQIHFDNCTRFDEGELWLILWSLVSSGAHLQRLKMFHGDIRPQTLMVSERGLIKLAPNGTFPPFFDNIDGYHRAFTTGEPVYVAPELLLLLQQGSPNTISINRSKSDIFSLGLTLLECMTLKSSTGVYNFSQMIINQELVDHRINETRFMYSKLLTNMIQGFLCQKPELRPDFVQLELLLKPYQRHIYNKQPFEISLFEAQTALSQNNSVEIQRFQRKKAQSRVFEDPPRRSLEIQTFHTQPGQHLLPITQQSQPIILPTQIIQQQQHVPQPIQQAMVSPQAQEQPHFMSQIVYEQPPMQYQTMMMPSSPPTQQYIPQQVQAFPPQYEIPMQFNQIPLNQTQYPERTEIKVPRYFQQNDYPEQSQQVQESQPSQMEYNYAYRQPENNYDATYNQQLMQPTLVEPQKAQPPTIQNDIKDLEALQNRINQVILQSNNVLSQASNRKF